WAFILTVTVWFAAVTAADPNEILTYPSPVPLEIIGQSPALVIVGTVPEQIELTLQAPRSVWEQLTTEEDAVRAILDLSGLEAGEYSLTPQIQIKLQPVRVISVAPPTEDIVLETLITRRESIDLSVSGEPAVGYQAGNISLAPNEVVISGAQSLVEALERVRAHININGARENIEEIITLQPLDSRNQIINGLTLSPNSVQISLPISQQGGYRDMAVKVLVNGQVASGYRLTNISVFPPVVTAYSLDLALINELPGVVETQPLEIGGISEDISTRLALDLPENVSIVGEQSVLIQVSIEPILSSLTLSAQQLDIKNLAPGLVAELSPQTVDVIISGPLPLLDTFSPQDDFRVVLDVAGLDIGTHQLTPVIEIFIDDITVISVLPETIEVTISEAPAITATPQP
ncbi:MAG: hypothetical protein L3J16_04515, partial [Anaerolineales bacterium]|nr:hypothetical protein [Anaerolineales bacterium]